MDDHFGSMREGTNISLWYESLSWVNITDTEAFLLQGDEESQIQSWLQIDLEKCQGDYCNDDADIEEMLSQTQLIYIFHGSVYNQS